MEDPARTPEGFDANGHRSLAADPLAEAVRRCAEYGGGEPFNFKVDLDKATVIPGNPGIWDGLVIAQWA